ncbi:hypothetical protein ACJH6H_29685, partial [Mycobacterium sp. SMC-21]|uniref:hypothetical protein n=1 Tax=Mycobacterium sp. SMC-21 TaxID=3381632 RepID=UPI00387776F8
DHPREGAPTFTPPYQGSSTGSDHCSQAASFVILLDAVRAGWSVSSDVLNEQLGRFYDHLARGLYIEAYDGCPATLGEIERYLDMERRALFLDGPNDVDWIFQNEIVERREGQLYVDYVAYEHGCEWTSPLGRDQSYRRVPKVVDLVLSLRTAGVCNADVLDNLVDVWRQVDITDRNLHWQSVHRANIEIADDLLRRSRGIERVHIKRILNDWIHPLNHLDMSLIKVTRAELQARRDQWMSEQWN